MLESAKPVEHWRCETAAKASESSRLDGSKFSDCLTFERGNVVDCRTFATAKASEFSTFESENLLG